MTIITVLNSLAKQDAFPLTREVKENILQIQAICNAEFSNQSFFGNSSLNRQMLLDERIAKLLTPSVIAYLFSNETADSFTIHRNSGGPIKLRDAISYGFSSGVETIKYLTNNELDFGPTQYEAQKNNFAQNTMRIVENISVAAGLTIPAEESNTDFPLLETFEEIIQHIERAKSSGNSSNLLKVPGYSPNQMRSQVGGGLHQVCDKLQIPLQRTDAGNFQIPNETLISFCEKFLTNPNVLLDGIVIHLFYDRAHIEAALEQDTTIKIGEIDYKYQDIFREMVKRIEQNPHQYPECAREQFYFRIAAVKKDIESRRQELGLPLVTVNNSQNTPNPIPTVVNFQGRYAFARLLKELEEKSIALTANGNSEAAHTSSKLHEALKSSAVQYFKTPNVENFEQFKSSCHTAIEKSRPVLETHRGWKEFFGKLFLTIATLGTVPLALATRNKIQTGDFSYQLFKTNSQKLVDSITKELDSVSLEPNVGR